MGTTYFRRYRMEISLDDREFPTPALPERYGWVAWNDALIERHSLVKFDSFRGEVDSQVFASLGQVEGCRRLMSEIAGHEAFLPPATWMITFQSDAGLPQHDCATIQGLKRTASLGAIQNVGVIPEHRGFGLGRAIVLRALQGFQQAGLQRVYLEVTASNLPAVRLYQSIGFRLTRTMYKAVDQVVRQAAAL